MTLTTHARPAPAISLDELRGRIARLENARRPVGASVTTGCRALDDLLPERGFRRGTLVEWISAAEGVGAGTVALLAAREACGDAGVVVALDGRGEFFPPAAARLGIDLARLIVVRPENTADHDWAMYLALRSPAVAAVLAWPAMIDGHTFRRWQLAAEEGGALGLLLRSTAARFECSWADVRLWVEPAEKPRPVVATDGATTGRGFLEDRRRLRIVLLHCRGSAAGRILCVELDDETYSVHPTAGKERDIANCRSQIAN